jgi:regulator of sigma E protease
MFLAFEAVSGKRVPPEKEGYVHMIGFILLMILMVFVLYNDITRFFR